MTYFLRNFPEPDILIRKLKDNPLPEFREVNGHIHTPFSFSAFPDLDSVFTAAGNEQIAALGINDFFVTDGYRPFYEKALKSKVFPVFNIEFIGLVKEKQKDGIRINDPNNPGRIYFSGKGLDFPFSPGLLNKLKLNRIKKESQFQIREMIKLLNNLMVPYGDGFSFTYESIKRSYANELVRERHLAKAIRVLASEKLREPEKQLHFIESLYGGKKSAAGLSDPSALENEIRSNLLKKGGAAFVEENEDSFLPLEQIIKIIISAGGIPCYPVLLDDPAGNYTEFEKDPEQLHHSLSAMKVGCIELIPGRNDHNILREFVEFFYSKNYVITFGTEHNTPEMLPLTVASRGGRPLDNDLKAVSWEGICVIAAHQYLRANGRQGYVLPNGDPSAVQKKELAYLGKMVIEYFLNNKTYDEKGNR